MSIISNKPSRPPALRKKTIKKRKVRPKSGLKLLLDIGLKGHFPIFYANWIKSTFRSLPKDIERPLTGEEKHRVNIIIERLGRHRSLENKKTILLALNGPQRALFIRAFLKMVEGKVIDKGPKIQ